MSYNMTPTCITCGRNRRAYDECGYTINDEWTCEKRLEEAKRLIQEDVDSCCCMNMMQLAERKAWLEALK